MLLYFLIGLQLLLIMIVTFYSVHVLGKLLRTIHSKSTIKMFNQKLKRLL
jgi:hypothetical protein